MTRLAAAVVLSIAVISTTLSAAFLAGDAETIIVDGRTRAFVLERPAVPGPRPAVIMLPGANASIGEFAGLSLGGVMTLRVVCDDAGMLTAIGLIISAMPESIGDGCRPNKPLPVLMINGTADRILPDPGSQSIRGDNVWPNERLVGFFRRRP